MHREFDFQESGDLFGLYGRIDERPHAAANEVEQMMIVLHLRVFGENAAFFRLRNMRFECEHAVASCKTEQIVHALERLLRERLCCKAIL